MKNMDCYTDETKNEEANIIIHKLMCEEQHMHNERVWNIKHGLVHHSFAVGPAARWALNYCIDDLKLYTCNKRDRDAGPP